MPRHPARATPDRWRQRRPPRWFGACTEVENQHCLRHVLQTQYDELRASATFTDPQAGVMLGMVDKPLTQLDSMLLYLATTVQTQRQQQEPPSLSA